MGTQSFSPLDAAAGRPPRSSMKKQAFPEHSAAKKRVLFNEITYAVPSGELVTPSAENAYRYSSLDRAQRRAEGLALRDSVLIEKLVAQVMQKL